MQAQWSSDRERAALVAAGDERALASLCAELHRPLCRVAEAYVGAGALAEDLVQETWEAVIDHIASFEARSSLRTWVTRILVNRAKTRLARDGRTVSLEAAAEAGEDPTEAFGAGGFWRAAPAYAVGPEQALVERQAAEWLGRALATLPTAQRTVVTLRDVEDWTSDEVCNALGLSESNQRVLLHRGRTRLRAALEQALRAERGEERAAEERAQKP
ncbi:MAG: RNA polymerase sigma factor [Polyangiaceae bacterium]|nr:RNA polymerase sigma factor [Polyangiaceae bacterium]